MVLSKSTSNNATTSKKQECVINTATMNGEDLNQLLQLNAEIEELRRQRHSIAGTSYGAPLLKATMTREEIFECSSLDDDRFLSALEHQNSYVAPSRQITDLDLSSIENMMKYFNEDVPTTPPKSFSTTGKVASVIANFKSKAAAESPKVTPTKTPKQLKKPEVRANIMELKKKYESPSQSSTLESAQPLPAVKMQKFPMKVKEIAQLFNSKITQVMRRSSDAQNYEPLKNEYSPEPKPAPMPVLNLATEIATTPTKPVAKPRVKPPTYRIGLHSPVPSPRASPRLRKKLAVATPKTPNMHNTCLVAEDVFRELSVKDKVLLFNKFIGDMSKKNPKFTKHAEVIKENVKQQMARGEVINEKQATVKSIAKELEAKCVLNTEHNQLQRGQSLRVKKRQAPLPPINKCKEAEDVPTTPSNKQEDNNSLHVSTLTVVLKPSPDAKERKYPPTPRLRASKRREISFIHEQQVTSTHKRNIASIRASLPTEAYAPPKKIRRTRTERSESQVFFQNEQLENLFYNWLREENGVLFDITSTTNRENTIEIAFDDDADGDAVEEVELTENGNNTTAEVTQKSAVERLLEEAIAKLEESKQEKQVTFVAEEKPVVEELKSCSTATTATPVDTPPTATPRKVKRQAPPVPAPRPSLITSSCVSLTSSSAKQSDVESESGLSTLPKITSDESQPESMQTKSSNDGETQEVEFAKPVRPARKKKMRRTLTWKKDNSIVETNPISTTDSDSDGKQANAASAAPKHKQFTNFAKKLLQKNLGILTPNKQPNKPISVEQSFAELNKSLMRQVNSPRKIKSAYTLTVMTTPSPNTESDYYETETPRESLQDLKRETSRSWPAALNSMETKDAPFEEKSVSSELTKKEQQRHHLIDSSVDQGFETGSNEIESPMRALPKKLETFIISQERTAEPSAEKEKTRQCRLSLQFNNSKMNTSKGENKKLDNLFEFSTPVKGHSQRSFNSSLSAPQQLISPIAQPIKQRRRSIYDAGEARRSSMQVIREDHPLDLAAESASAPQSPFSPSSFNANESHFFANAPTMDMPTSIESLNSKEAISNFWITAGDFTISAEIFHTAPDRLRLLYEIFTQKSCETRELCFGIDGYKFSLDAANDMDSNSKRLPKDKECSHFWFATGDLAVPFSGKLMCGDKVKRLFKFVRESVSDINELRFGVDNFEFSSVPEFWHSVDKFSMESNYSMLVGLQTGNSNGLEGRSKYAWPCTGNNAAIGFKTSDLDQSELESDGLSNSGRLSFSPFGSNQFEADDLVAMQNPSRASTSPDSFNLDFENEPLDQLFEQVAAKQRLSNANKADAAKTVTEMIKIVNKQQAKLKSVEERIRGYPQPANMSSNSLDQLKDSSEYLRKLRNIVRGIDNIGSGVGFKTCSLEQLETYMFFLSRYAEICLGNCSVHMDKILDTLMDRRAVQV